MVRAFLVLVALVSTSAWAELSWDEYNKAIGDGEEAIDYSGTLTPHDRLHDLIPEPKGDAGDGGGELGGSKSNNSKEEAGDNDKNGPGGQSKPGMSGGEKGGAGDATKKSGSLNSQKGGREKKGGAGGDEGGGAHRKRSSGSSESEYVYISPSLRKGKGASQSNEVLVIQPTKAAIQFGIPIGTQIRVTMSKGASSAQKGSVVLIVDETVKGQVRDLLRGSKLFAIPRVVNGSERLYLSVQKGLVPGDLEDFSINGMVYAEDGEPGLMASVVSDGKAIQRAAIASSSELAGGLIDVVGGGSLAAEAGKVGAKSVLNEKEDEEGIRTGRPEYIVKAAPQKGVLFVDATF